MPSRSSFVDDVAPRPLAVVGEKQERNVGSSQFADEAIGAGDQFVAAINDAVHVDEVAEHKNALLGPMFSRIRKYSVRRNPNVVKGECNRRSKKSANELACDELSS